MAHVLAARVAETSTTTGTGAFALSAALAGHQRFSAVCAVSDTTEYMIVADDGSWEEGVGTYSSANTLTRTTITNSSNAGAAVNFAAGSKTVLMTPLASRVGGIPRSTAIVKGNGSGALVDAVAGADYLAPSAIGTTVQAYDADLTTWGGKAAPSGSVVGTTDAQTLINKTLTDPAIVGAILESVYTITDGASVDIDPGNGTIQLWTLGASRTPTATNFAAGESVTLMIDDGTARTITWTTIGVTWKTDGGSAPALNTTGYTVIVLWKVGTTIYGARVGDA